MPDDELIYRITRAIYDRLGGVADEPTVEQLVTEIYRAVEPALAKNGAARIASVPQSSDLRPAEHTGSADRLVISVFGVDHPGIVAGVSQILAEADCSIVDTTRSQSSAIELKERFRSEGEQLGVRIYAQREDLFNAMHRI